MGIDAPSTQQVKGTELPRPTPGVPLGRRRTGLGVALVGLPLLTLLLVHTDGALGLGSVLLLYLLVDVVAAAIGGLPAGVLAAVVSVLGANWFFVPPFHTLAVETRDSVIELVVFAMVALIVSLTVDLAARDRAFATRSALEAALLARFAAMPAAELSLPVLHFESLDAATVSWCRDWRAEIRMTDLAAEVAASPAVTVGAVDYRRFVASLARVTRSGPSATQRRAPIDVGGSCDVVEDGSQCRGPRGSLGAHAAGMGRPGPTLPQR